MEKIKNVLHGHKKNDHVATNETQTSSSSGEHLEGKHAPVGQPLYDIKTVDGKPYTTLAQPGDSLGLHGKAEYTGADGPTDRDNYQSISQTHAKDGGNASIVPMKVQEKLPESVERAVPNAIHDTGETNKRPEVKSKGTETSTASIKSGIIGFGPGQKQGHAAVPANNPVEQNVQQSNMSAPHTSQSITGPGASLGAIKEQQPHPHESTLRQESYTADTDRSFPLAGGVTSHHDNGHGTSASHPVNSVSSTASPASSSQHPTEPTSTLHQASIAEDTGNSHGQDGLPASAAVAAAIAAQTATSSDRNRDIHSHNSDSAPHAPSHSHPKEEQGLLAKAKNLIGLGTSKEQDTAQQECTGNNISRDTHDHHPEALAAATAAAAGAASRSSQPHPTVHDSTAGSLPSYANPDAGHSVENRPQAVRLESRHRHIPGEFISTPGEHGNTFLDYTTVVQPTSTSAAPAPAPVIQPTPLPHVHDTHHTPDANASTVPSPTTDHELRHTGTLDEPLSRSAEDDHHHHHGKDAALAGGVGVAAGATALGGHAAHESRATTELDTEKPIYEEINPYSAKMLDPRVTGTLAPLDEQRFDPETKTEASPHSAAQAANPTGISSVSGSQNHIGRDAGVVGGAVIGGAALHQSHQHNDKASIDPAVRPQESTEDNTFYGTAGAPAPIVEHTSQHRTNPSNLDPASTSTSTAVSDKSGEHHYGRSAGVAGAGALGVAGVYAATRDKDNTSGTGIATGNEHASSTGPASKTIGPHASNVANVLDPRVKPDPTIQKGHNATGPHASNTINRIDPKVDEQARQQHDQGRDTALIGGAGAAGLGAHEAMQAYADHRMTQPKAAMNEQRYDPTSPGARAPNPVAPKSEYNYNDPVVHRNVNDINPETQSNVGRGAALGGLAGAGLVGAGAYAGSKHADNTQQLPLHQGANQASSPTQGTTAPQNTQVLGSTSQAHGTTIEPQYQSHDKRDAALLGAGGAVAVRGGPYALSQQDERERARLANREQDRLKKEAQEREKEQHKLEKEQHKHDKEVHKHDKVVATHKKDDHHLQKEQEKEQKRLTKEQHEREKEAEKAEKEKKGGLLGFLHRDKSKKENSSSPDSSPRASRDNARRSSRDYSPRHSKEYAAGSGALGTGAVAGAGAMAYDENHPDHPRWKGKNLLHKEPPKGHPARDMIAEHPHSPETGLVGGKREHMGIDGPIGDPNLISGDRETRKGVYGAHPIADASRATTVIEPHTGLPMNVGKYGPGTGGTDGNPAIHGQHEHSVGSTAPGQKVPDWAGIKKADTPY